MSRLVDLSQEIYQGMFVYPGHLKTVIWDHATHEETGPRFESDFSFHSQGVMLCDHGPTHVDAIKHLDPTEGAPAIDEMPLDTFYAPGVCVDVAEIEAPSDVGPEHVEAALEQAGVELRPGDALLLRTGTFDRYGGTADYATKYPGLAEETGEWIVERGVRIFGVDSPSPDNPLSRTYPIHLMCRREGITHYENLANLDQIAGRRFQFIGFPLRIRGGTGSPVRAVAVLED